MVVITGELERETGSAEAEQWVKPQGGCVFRGDMDVFRTSISNGHQPRQHGQRTGREIHTSRCLDSNSITANTWGRFGVCSNSVTQGRIENAKQKNWKISVILARARRGKLRKAEGEGRSRRGSLSTNLEPHKPTTCWKTVIWLFPE